MMKNLLLPFPEPTEPIFKVFADDLRLPLGESNRPGIRRAQAAAAHSIAAHFWSRKNPAIVVMPTGSGKTAVMLLASILLRATRVLIIVPSRLLREQIANSFRALDPLVPAGALPLQSRKLRVLENESRIGRENGWTTFNHYDVVVSTPYTISPKLTGINKPPEDLFDLIIFDEGHHVPAPTFLSLSESFSTAKQLLFTATPYRRDQQKIPGDIIFTYDVGQARRDGIFGRLKYVPVTAPNGGSRDAYDRQIALSVEAKLKRDRDAGLDHRIIVRASGKRRAEELLTLYKNETDLHLKTVHSNLRMSTVRKTLQLLRQGKLDGVVAVDMLGEGFDLPNLKIAALHSPHRSLAVTLQFIGRFARTSKSSRLGEATFFAIPEEIEGEAARLYAPGAEWNEIVEDLSRDRIVREQSERRFLSDFVRPRTLGPSDLLSGDDGALILRSLNPNFHIKIYDLSRPPDFDARIELPSGTRPILIQRSKRHNTLVWIGEKVSPPDWLIGRALNNTRYDLFVAIHSPKHKTLAILSSQGGNSGFSSIATSLVGEDNFREFSPYELSRIYRGIESIKFLNIGMRNRAGLGGGGAESYRMLAGPSPDKAIRAADGDLYDRGHGFCIGEEAGQQVTLGVSNSSKVWSLRRGQLSELVIWTEEISKKLRNPGEVITKSGMDQLGVPHRISEFNSRVIAGDLPRRAYLNPNRRVRINNGDCWLIDMEISILESSRSNVNFRLSSGNLFAEYSLTLGKRPQICSLTSDSQHAFIESKTGNCDLRLVDFLNDNPPVFFLEDLGSVEGDQYHRPPYSAQANVSKLEITGIDWAANRINPHREKPTKTGRELSIFDFVESTLTQQPETEIVFCDDGSNEMADFISIIKEDTLIVVNLFHCKAASKESNVPNNRTEDLYEVVAQAVKCRKWMDARRLISQLEHRSKKTKNSRFLKGDLELASSLLDDISRVVFCVTIVQPAIGLEPKEQMSDLLKATDAYMRGAGARPLRIWGSVLPGGQAPKPTDVKTL